MVYIENKKMFFRKVKIKENKIYISKINKKTAKKVIKKLKKYNIKKVVCCKEVNQNKDFINKLYSENIDIYNGRILYKYVINNIFEYLKKLDFKLEQMNAVILVNENSSINNHIIFSASNMFKSISITTNNSKKFLKIEKELENSGITVNMTNNKRKSLKKAQIILNIDFTNELINKYVINNKAIIINIEEKTKVESKKFQGINVNYYKIDFEKKFLEYEDYDKNTIYEGLFMEEIAPCSPLKLKIKYLIGNRGIISENEFTKLVNV